MNLLDDEIQKSLNTDIIRQVEETAKEFGVTDEKLIQGTSLALFIQHNKDKSNLLHISGDSYHNIKLENYLDILQQEGFQNILEIPFHSNQWNYDDVFYIFWHPQKFILLELDSYNKKSVNGAKFYFNWVPNNLHDSWNYLHSGGFSEFIHGAPTAIKPFQPTKRYVWVGYNDAKEAIRFQLRQLSDNGTFVKWVEKPFLWLLHYEDVKKDGYDYEQINNQRINLFPQDVKEMILNAPQR